MNKLRCITIIDDVCDYMYMTNIFNDDNIIELYKEFIADESYVSFDIYIKYKYKDITMTKIILDNIYIN